MKRILLVCLTALFGCAFSNSIEIAEHGNYIYRIVDDKVELVYQEIGFQRIAGTPGLVALPDYYLYEVSSIEVRDDNSYIVLFPKNEGSKPIFLDSGYTYICDIFYPYFFTGSENSLGIIKLEGHEKLTMFKKIITYQKSTSFFTWPNEIFDTKDKIYFRFERNNKIIISYLDKNTDKIFEIASVEKKSKRYSIYFDFLNSDYLYFVGTYNYVKFLYSLNLKSFEYRELFEIPTTDSFICVSDNKFFFSRIEANSISEIYTIEKETHKVLGSLNCAGYELDSYSNRFFRRSGNLSYSENDYIKMRKDGFSYYIDPSSDILEIKKGEEIKKIESQYSVEKVYDEESYLSSINIYSSGKVIMTFTCGGDVDLMFEFMLDNYFVISAGIDVK